MALQGIARLLHNATTTGPGPQAGGELLHNNSKTVQAWGRTTSGTGSATISIEGRLDNDAPWQLIGTITIPLSTVPACDSFTLTSVWQNIRANLTAISGTGASANCSLGY